MKIFKKILITTLASIACIAAPLKSFALDYLTVDAEAYAYDDQWENLATLTLTKGVWMVTTQAQQNDYHSTIFEMCISTSSKLPFPPPDRKIGSNCLRNELIIFQPEFSYARFAVTISNYIMVITDPEKKIYAQVWHDIIPYGHEMIRFTGRFTAIKIQD